MATKEQVILEQLVHARIGLLLKCPFWGLLSMRLKLKDVTDDGWLETAATDGRHIYYNRNFIAKLDKQETMFLLAHEVEHVVYDHMGRRGSRGSRIWNVAADYVINWELHDNNIGKLPDPKRTGITACFDKKYAGMSADEVYCLLEKDKKFVEYVFDVHMEPGDPNGEQLTEEELATLRDEIRQAVMEAAKANTGHLPNGVKRLLKDITEPQMNWRELLNMQIQSAFKNDYTWMKQSRKTMSSGIYLPGQLNDQKLEVAIALDSSGSISDKMLQDFLGEVKGIMSQFSDFELRLWCSDTEVYNPVMFTPENIHEIDEYEVMGRGGNDFNCNWEYMKENNIVPSRFIHFTDGYDCGLGFGDPDWCETIYVIHSDPSRKIESPFGTTCWYDQEG
jgi:predicted metal-dependent peptidase